MARRKTPSGDAASDTQGSSKKTFKRKGPQEGSNTTQKAIIGILNAAEGRPASEDGISACMCIVLKENSRSKPYQNHPLNLVRILGEKWNISSTYRDIFGEEKPSGEKCKAIFCELFGLELARVDIKEKWTLVFALQEDGAIGNLRSQKDPPGWVAKAAKAAIDLSPNPAPSAAQSPASSTDRSPPPKKQRKEPTQIDLCMKTIKEELTKEEVGNVKELLDDLLNIVDGNTLQPSHFFGKDRVAKTKAGVLFAVLLARMGGGTLLSALSHLWIGNQKCKTLASAASTGVAASSIGSAANAPATVDNNSETSTAQTNLPVINIDDPIPDEVAQSITDNVLRSVKKNQGKAITLPPSLSMAFGAMAYAQTSGCWTDSKISRIVAARTGLQNNHSVSTIVLPTEYSKVDPAKTAVEPRHKAIGDEIVDALPPATQIAVMHSAIRAQPELAASKVGPVSPEEFLANLRLPDEVSEAIAVYCDFSTQQEKDFNRCINYAKGHRVFSAIDKRKRATKRKCHRVSSRFDKVKLKERVKGGKTRDRLYNRYSSSMMEVIARDLEQLEEHGLLLSCGERLNKPEWNDSTVLVFKADRGQGSLKGVINNICVEKPQSLGRTKLVKLVKLAKDTYENLRDGFFSPKDKLKQELEDLLNNRSVALLSQYDGKTQCAVARHNGKKKIGNGHGNELPSPMGSVRISKKQTKDRVNKKHRFNFHAVESSKYLVEGKEVHGIAFFDGLAAEIGRIYFGRSLEATKTPHNKSGATLKKLKLRGLISADFELLSNIFGHVGGAAMRSCLWCEMLKSEFYNLDDADEVTRTRDNIAQHYCKFVQQMDQMDEKTKLDEKAKKQYEDKAHQENGSIRRPALLDIDPTDCVCMPLHIILGITKKLNEFFRKCLEVIDDMSSDASAVESKYALKRLRGKLVRRMLFLRRQIIETAVARDPTLNSEEILTEISNMPKKTAVEKNTELLKRIGYAGNAADIEAGLKEKADQLILVTQCLEEADVILADLVGKFESEFFLAKKANGVDETVYHQDFVGNDCVKFCRRYGSIFAQVKNKVEADGSDGQIASVRNLVRKSETMWKEWAALVLLMKRCDYFKGQELQQINALSVKIPKLIKDFVDDPPVNIKLTYPQQVKLHCLAALHLYYFAEKYNTIGIISEESGESIHNKWNRLTGRFVNRRGIEQEKGAVLELERHQDPKTQKWIDDMLKATARYSEEEKAERKAARSNANEINSEEGDDEDDDEDNNIPINNNGVEEEQIDVNNPNGGGDDGDDDEDDDYVQIQYPDCKHFFPTNFLPFHQYHAHSSDVRPSLQRLAKDEI